jgi:hypothetical protein
MNALSELSSMYEPSLEEKPKEKKLGQGLILGRVKNRIEKAKAKISSIKK